MDKLIDRFADLALKHIKYLKRSIKTKKHWQNGDTIVWLNGIAHEVHVVKKRNNGKLKL